MKLYTAQVVAALALVVPFLICAADQQNKYHDNMASNDAGDDDSSDDSHALAQLEELVYKNMDEEEVSEGVDMENEYYDAQRSQYEDDSAEQTGKYLLSISFAILKH